ncbi:uncharacterized protein FIBRA_03890 [Fibroporia radiculosa]|uniref:GH18 domain-containing protein n=1 Tax=Fibroporia radiculosa TaxID=599839 RepID=J4HW85_9APHY|nr:uncharacterized protein FIBRA_03890 [Fibroporia radiculosa]CCM01822.1 predicted protein [Fibroporia radiculosa]
MFFSFSRIVSAAAVVACASSALAAPICSVSSSGVRTGSSNSTSSTSGIANVGSLPTFTSSFATPTLTSTPVVSSAPAVSSTPVVSSVPVVSSPAVSTPVISSAPAVSSTPISSAPVPTTTSGSGSSNSTSGSGSSNSTSGSGGSTSSSGPHFLVYSDAWVSGENGPPNVSEINGYNVFALSFLLASGSVDQAQEWEELDASTRASIKSQYNAAGVKLIVSAFGSTEAPTSSGDDPVNTANTMAAWVKQYDLDGIDIDYEDFDAINSGNGAVDWLVKFTTQLRSQLPSGQYIITHAPVAPWFSNNAQFQGGAYLQVDQQVGSMIDWYNVQFYNQGASEYTDCTGLLTQSSSTWPKTSVFEIAAAGVDLNKLVIGKPATASDATNGYMDPATLATCVDQAKGKGWNAGVMVWEFPSASQSWISTVRGSAYPV